MSKTFLSLNWPPLQSESHYCQIQGSGSSQKFIIKKGGKHKFDDMMPEVKQFADWFDKYLK